MMHPELELRLYRQSEHELDARLAREREWRERASTGSRRDLRSTWRAGWSAVRATARATATRGTTVDCPAGACGATA